jgi:protein-S-isoprenylcysteine O-methyltransferase Ste14
MRSWSLGRVVLFELLMALRRFAILAVQLIPCLLLTLAGWGWDDWRGFFSHPARAGLIAAIVLGAGLVLRFQLDLQPLRRGRSVVGSQTLVLLVLVLTSLFLVWFLPFADRREMLRFTQHPFLRYLGLVMCCLGIAVRLLALAKLGRHFSAYVTLQDDHQLVQSGIYGMVRHPLYLSLLLAAPGFALVFASVLVWPILLMALAFVTLRIREEDNLLESRFGVEFREYRGRTGALLPRVG